jgi:hypothetical protein
MELQDAPAGVPERHRNYAQYPFPSETERRSWLDRPPPPGPLPRLRGRRAGEGENTQLAAQNRQGRDSIAPPLPHLDGRLWAPPPVGADLRVCPSSPPPRPTLCARTSNGAPAWLPPSAAYAVARTSCHPERRASPSRPRPHPLARSEGSTARAEGLVVARRPLASPARSFSRRQALVCGIGQSSGSFRMTDGETTKFSLCLCVSV